MMTAIRILATGLALSVAAAAGPAVAQSVTIKLAHESPSTHAKGIWAEDFKKAVESRSGARIKVELYPQGQLYKSEQAGLEAAVAGLIQMAIPSTGYVSAIVRDFEVVDLPMIFKDQASLYRFQDGPLGQGLLAQLDAKGLKGIAYISNVALDLFSKTKIATPAEFSGRKIRAHSAVLEQTVRALGGNPVSMRASELYLALEQGIVDGAFTTVTFAAPNKYHEVTPFLTRASVSAIAYPVVVNGAFWRRLPDDLKAAMTAAAADATKANRDTLSVQEETALESLRKGGITVVELSDAQRMEWRTRLQAVYDSVKDKIDPKLIQGILALN